jgi:hypothetical protein
MSKQLFPHKILWLASYPKSGNTWFRAFLTALLNDGEVDINQMASDGIFSSRETFDLVADIDSRDLYDDEAKLMVADVYRCIAAETNALSIIKVHDFFGPDPQGNNLVPEDVTQCAIYFIRNPLDIAGSLANHMNFSIEEAINMLNNSDACMAGQPGNLNKNMQFRQYLSDWSSHVNSWTLQPSFPVYVIRYEDALINTFESFTKALNFIGWQYSIERILNAALASGFDNLRKQEEEKGFKEKQFKTSNFFRSGITGSWEKELNKEQAKKIISMHRINLEKYKYLI